MKQEIPLSAGSISAGRLVVELELLYICAHCALELNWQKSGLRLPYILYILNTENLDWNQVFLWLDKSPNTAKCFYILLTLFNEEQLFNVSDDRLNDLANYAPGINYINRRLLTRFVKKHLLLGEEFGVLLSESNLSIIWHELLFGRFHPTVALFVIVPYRLLFPSAAKKSTV